MPAATSPSRSQRRPQALVIGESAEAAYRYASSDAAELELVVVGADAAADAVGDSFDRVVVVGFTSSPDKLRTVVDRAFELVDASGQVLVGSSAGPVEPDVAAWDAAFVGLRVVSVDQGYFPSVELARGAEGSAGTFLAGALSVLGLTNPHPDIKAAPVPPPVATATTGAKPSARRSSRWQTLLSMARSRSKLLIAAAVGMLVALAISVGLVALLGKYFLATVLTLTLCAVLALALRQEQRNRQIGRQLAQAASGQSRFRAKLFDQVRSQGKDIARIQKVIGVSQLAIVDTAKTLERLQVSFKDPTRPGLLREVNRETKATFEQIQATINLFEMVDVTAPVPPMRGWAVSPDALNLLVQELMTVRPGLVVECGSGISTLWLGLMIKKLGLDARVVALDHDEEYVAKTNRMLAQHGVDGIATARHAPLTDVSTGAGSQPWYDPAATEDLDGIGLLFVDGPPKPIAEMARMPALPVLWDKLAPQASIVLDDMIRQDEKEIVALWRQQHPELVAEDFRTEKGTCILRRP
jgi:predicted O-methyltransferase YrrM